jgi:adenylosuccinate synthase
MVVPNWLFRKGEATVTCTIVVGGQFGSEGKGKVVALEAALKTSPWVVRCGGPNSGHTVSLGGRETVLRQIPAGAGHPNSLLLLSAGCVISEQILADEVRLSGIGKERLIVDPRAVVLSSDDILSERNSIHKAIGSTASGTGAALARRMARDASVRLAASSPILQELAQVKPVAPLLHSHLNKGGDVIVEGTQGFGLSLLHGLHYPFVTSRDTTASGFASEVGLSPRAIDSIIMVIRTYPIRVSGNSGPLPGEVSWEYVAATSGSPEVIPEYTSVTRRLRRVAAFDMAAVQSACAYNCPTSLAVMGLDRLDYLNSKVPTPSELTDKAREFIAKLENVTGIRVKWVGIGFSSLDALNLFDYSDWGYLSHAKLSPLSFAHS